MKPSFDNSTESTVLGAEKGSTVLPCRVRNVGDLTVSWVRKSDYHILTAGSQMYTNDVRYSIIHPKNSSDWMLKIGALRLDDEGVYECQTYSSYLFKINVSLIYQSIKGARLNSRDGFVKHPAFSSIMYTVQYRLTSRQQS
ncbi:unnamed protein product [Cyprideis torosa]|uniref:Uncharacterized protein n=1 Tax=Cyprideis torosa TaxID=163714 RepID=A0A7R8WX04_9CRUS|nr:unnamed protein product [Cyprideis torosa]CAG0908317.1 unnamed protein product [Cyprideis torosa]